MTSRRRTDRCLVAAIVLAVVACQPTTPAPSFSGAPPATSTATATPAPTVDRVAGWRGDLERLVPAMDAIHPDLTHGTTRTALDQAVEALISEIEVSTDDRLMAGVLRIVALVSAAGCDGHTGAFIWGTGSYPVDSLPLRLWLFEDEVVIVDALPPYEGLIGSRIDSIEGRPIGEVTDALDPLIPRDNEQTVRLLTPRYLLIPQVLRGLGLADPGPIAMVVRSGAGTTRLELLEPVPMAEYNAWAGPYGLHLPTDPDLLYLSRIGDALWWELLPDARTLFVQYNRVEHLSTGTLDELTLALRDPNVERVILDIRHNFGGEVSALDLLLEQLEQPDVGTPGELFVISGRNTFSAGSLLLARLEASTDATIVGEPMGGCPTFYGDTTEVPLPYSGLSILVSGMLEVGADPADDRSNVELDQIATLRLEDWLDGRDPALELIVLDAP